MARLTPEQVETMRAVRESGGSYREAAKQAGCGASTVASYFPDSHVDQGDSATGGLDRVSESDGVRTIEKGSDKRIRTLEDAIAFAGVDTSVWRVKSWSCTSWEVGMKMREGKEADRFERHGLWRVALKLERIWPQVLTDATDALFERLRSIAPRRFDRPRLPSRRGGSLLEINIPDLHMGKLCWAPETGVDYDMRIAEQVYDEAVRDLLDRARGFDVEEAVFLIGSDFFHVDTLGHTTTAGTVVDVDGRHAKMIEIGEASAIHAVNRVADACRKVRVIWVPGNHDRLASFHLARTLAAWFRHDDRVTVDAGPMTRKYLRYGVNLIGYTHGDKIKLDKLAMLMASERSQDWAQTTWREWHVGHFHGFRMQESFGVRTRVVPSLCGTDAWHAENGYVGNSRAAEAFVYDKDDGFVANFTTKARV